MAHFYFKPFEEIEYKGSRVKNLMKRFKLRDALKNRSAVYYTYEIKDGERPDVVAEKYYGDSRLDWILFITNDIFDVEYDWPLSWENLNNFIKDKYGSIPEAKAQTHHFEKILTPFKKLFDGTIIKERTVEIDEETFNSLSSNETRRVSAYDHEIKLNEEKSTIKILDERHVFSIVKEAEGIFN